MDFFTSSFSSTSNGLLTNAAKTAFISVTAIAAVTTTGWLLVKCYLRDKEDSTILQTNSQVREAFLGSTTTATTTTTKSADAQQAAYDENTGAYNFQRRVQGPLMRNMDLPKDVNWLQAFAQQKEFIWIAGSNSEWHVGLALLQFNFIGVLVVNVWDVKNNTSWRRKVELPLASLWSRLVDGVGPLFVPGANGHSSPSSDGHAIRFGCSSNSSSRKGLSLGSLLCGGCEASVVFHESGAKMLASVSFSGGLDPAPTSQAAAIKSGRQQCNFQFTAEVPCDYLQMVFPIGPHRASIVAKFAGASTTTTVEEEGNCNNSGLNIRWEGIGAFTPPSATTTNVESFLIAMDYTRGLLRRETTWYWACVSATADVYHINKSNVPSSRVGDDSTSVSSPERIQKSGTARVGFHLSCGTYDDPTNNISYECTVYIDGRVVLLNRPVRFTHNQGTTVSSSTLQSRWLIHSEADDAVLLSFVPQDGHLGHFNYVAIRGALLHYWGWFSGTIRLDGVEYVLNQAPGVVEDHYALW